MTETIQISSMNAPFLEISLQKTMKDYWEQCLWIAEHMSTRDICLEYAIDAMADILLEISAQHK